VFLLYVGLHICSQSSTQGKAEWHALLHVSICVNCEFDIILPNKRAFQSI